MIGNLVFQTFHSHFPRPILTLYPLLKQCDSLIFFFLKLFFPIFYPSVLFARFSMSEDDVTVTDVLIDPTKNLGNILNTDNNQDFESVHDIELPDNEYFTETDFIDLTKTANLRKVENLFILSLNIANLLSKLSSLKSFLSNLAYNDCKPDLIFLVETHIPENQKSGYNKEDLMNIIPGYKFFSKGRKERKGGGVGILVNKDTNIEPKLCDANEVGVEYFEEKFENLVVKLPGCIEIGNSNSNSKKDLISVVIYRQPNSGNLDIFLDSLDQLLQKIDKPCNEMVCFAVRRTTGGREILKMKFAKCYECIYFLKGL